MSRDRSSRSRLRRPLALAVTVAILVLPLLILSVTVMRYLEFRAVTDGSAGTPGVTVVEKAHLSGSNDETCIGVFTPDGGGPPVEVDIEMDGRCEEGRRLPAVLVEPAAFHPDLWGRPIAWTPGTGTGEHLTPAIMVFLLLVLPFWIAAWVVRKQLWQSLRPRR